METQNTTQVSSIAKFRWILQHTPKEIRKSVAQELVRQKKMTDIEREEEERRRTFAQSKHMLEQYRQRAHDNCGLRGEQWLHTFKSFKLAGNVEEKNSQAEALRWARNYVHNFPNVEIGGLFYGRPGVGKDYFLHCITQALLDPSTVDDSIVDTSELPVYDVRYFYSLDIDKRLKQQWFDDEEGDLEQCMRELS